MKVDRKCGLLFVSEEGLLDFIIHLPMGVSGNALDKKILLLRPDDDEVSCGAARRALQQVPSVPALPRDPLAAFDWESSFSLRLLHPLTLTFSGWPCYVSPYNRSGVRGRLSVNMLPL